jgi:hypothetical protein
MMYKDASPVIWPMLAVYGTCNKLASSLADVSVRLYTWAISKPVFCRAWDKCTATFPAPIKTIFTLMILISYLLSYPLFSIRLTMSFTDRWLFGRMSGGHDPARRATW